MGGDTETIQMRQAALDQVVAQIGLTEDDLMTLTSEEFEEFRDTVPRAVTAYLQRDKQRETYLPGLWELEAPGFRYWRLEVQRRHKAEVAVQQAQKEFDIFVNEANAAINLLRRKLAGLKKPKYSMPAEVAKFSPADWFKLEPPLSRNDILKWSAPQIQSAIPEAARELIRPEVSYETLVVPSARYEIKADTPCVAWGHRRHMLVKVALAIPEGIITKKLHGTTFVAPATGKAIGDFYIMTAWDTVWGFTTPLSLLRAISAGKLETPEVTVVSRASPFTTYCVKGYPDPVEVHDLFRRFIESIVGKQTLGKGLVSAGVADGLSGTLVDEKMGAPLPSGIQVGEKAKATVPPSVSDGGGDSDVTAALEGMGYKKGEIKAMVGAAHFSSGMTFEEKVKAALKSMSA